jgi:L-seryl-tRNA(Ser) seleniumtransferase
LSNRTPSLRVWWDPQGLGFSGETISRVLLETEPRIAMAAARRTGPPAETGVTVTPYMMSPGDEHIVADRLHALLTKGGMREPSPSVMPAAADLTGRWQVRIDYAAGSSTHVLHIRQRNGELDGTHQGDFVSRDLTGTINGSDVRIRSSYGGQTGDSLSFSFAGNATGDRMEGTLDMGEYLTATWTARRG